MTSALLFFAVPLTLIYFLKGDGQLIFKLGLLAIELIVIALVGSGIAIFNQRMQDMPHYHGWEKVGVLLFASGGFISPTFRLFYRHASSAPELVSKFALYMSLPILAGWVIAQFSPRDIITGDILPNLNSLIIVAIGGLLIIITVKFLEEHLRINKFSLLPYTRLLLGIVLLFILSEGLV